MLTTRALAIVTFVFSTLLQGCVGSNIYYVDSRFSPEEEEDIKAAAAMWTDATGGALDVPLVFRMRVDVTEENHNAIVKVGSRAAFNRFPEMASEARAAFYRPGSALKSSLIVVIADRVEAPLVRPAVAHEMGHSFGLEHVNEERALMFENLHGDANKCVTEFDLHEAHRHVAFEDDRPCDAAKQ